jgi:hypothetical protein
LGRYSEYPTESNYSRKDAKPRSMLAKLCIFLQILRTSGCGGIKLYFWL